MDGRNPMPVGVQRARGADLPSLHLDSALVVGVCARKDLHEGALAGPVFPRQDVHLARVNDEINLVQDLHGTEVLRNVFH